MPQIEREPELREPEHVQKMDLANLRPRIREEVTDVRKIEGATAQRIVLRTREMFNNSFSNGPVGQQRDWSGSELNSLPLRPDAFKNCEAQFAYDRNAEIYSVSVNLNGRPRIITVRVGEDFTELSLMDKKKGEILEIVRQEDGKGVSFSRTPPVTA